MDCDLFSYWSRGEIRAIDIPDIYTCTKYLLTRDPVDARRDYPKLLPQHRFVDMGQFIPPPSLPKRLPLFSFLLQFRFKLATPYISRDDDAFYIYGNPIRKDKVFKMPMIPGTSWKGNMRWTAGKELEETGSDDAWRDLRLRLVRLFGQENKGEKRYFDSIRSPQVNDKFIKELDSQTTNGSRRGRLHFHPTFFNRIGLEVINPHSRMTKAGTQPIYFETVPAGEEGVFTLLYVPFDLLGKPTAKIQKEVADDLEIISDSLYKMMCRYGFSAKKGNSFGIAEEKIEGTFEMGGVKLPQKKVGQVKMAVPKTEHESPFAKLKVLKTADSISGGDVAHFSSFKALKELMDSAAREVGGLKHD